MTPLPPIRILSPTAILGYGFPESSFAAGLKMNPDVIAVDAGSTDPGPYYLGAGISFTTRPAVKRDLKLMLAAGRERDIPVLIGSAGGAGARQHLDWCVDIIHEIATEDGLAGKLAVIPTDIGKDSVRAALGGSNENDNGNGNGAIRPMPAGPPLAEEAVIASTNIVAQIGEAPLISALADGADVVIAGRCYDPAVFAALPIMRGYPVGLSLHMGKILECAAIAAVPGSGSDCMFATLDETGFTVETLSDDRICTVTSVAAHTLYEKSNPYRLPGPGGTLDLANTAFEQLDDRRVRVTGTIFDPSPCHMIKLEGARRTGYRTVSIAGVRAPDFIAGLDDILDGARATVTGQFPQIMQDTATLLFRAYGRDGVMGSLEPERHQLPHEIGLIIEAVAPTQDLADAICAFARSTLLHFGYEGRKSTAGNLAFPYSPSDFKAGEVYEFSVYHLMRIDDPVAVFPAEMMPLGGRP